MNRKIVFVAALLMTLSACASNSNYLGGTNTGIGSYAGSLAAVADSTSNSFVSLFLRGIAGGIVGAAAEERVTRSSGLQYTVEKNSGSLVAISSKVNNSNQT